MAEVKQEIIGPERAAKDLKNRHTNRAVKEEGVAKILRDIKSGRWMSETTDTIKYDTNGCLIDGQHRLEAIRRSGKEVTAWVARGVPREAIHVIDGGIPRSTADVLAIDGAKNAPRLSASITLLWRLLSGSITSSKSPSRLEAINLLETHPDIKTSVALAKELTKPLSPALVSGFHYVFSRIDKDKADTFFQKLHEGSDLPIDHPILQLRTKLLEKKPPRNTVLALVIKAWNLFLREETVKRLTFSTIREEFPAIQGWVEASESIVRTIPMEEKIA